MNKKNFVKMALIGAVVGLCSGLFGSGGGTVAVPAMERLLSMDEHKSHATAIAIILPLTGISAVLYSIRGFLNFNLAWQVSLGGVVGGVVGAKLLKKVSSDWLRKIFGAFMLIAAVRMVF